MRKWTESQLELGIARRPEVDRNWNKGGRSFYFFDFDDNVAFLSTPIIIFHKDTQTELALSSREYAQNSKELGKSGPYRDYELNLDDEVGSFRNFRDKDMTLIERFLRKKQPFVEDLSEALGLPDFNWKGPSWPCFYHAVFNRRPLSLITARGHHPTTIRQGISTMVREGHLPHEPNYLSLYPINHPGIQKDLLSDTAGKRDVPYLKQAALRASVELAINKYGENPHHRFGMSDDDPKNIDWILKEMLNLKSRYPEMSFFVISTSKGHMIKREVFVDSMQEQRVQPAVQMSLFESAELI